MDALPSMSHQSSGALPCQAAKDSRGEKTVAGQIASRGRPRYAGRRTAGREQIRQQRPILTFDAADAIDRKTALGVKQCAGDFDRMERRRTALLGGDLETFDLGPFGGESPSWHMHRLG